MSGVYLSDIPRLVTAIAEWGACLVAYLLCGRSRTQRLSGSRLWVTLGLGLVVQCLFLELTDGLRIIFWLPCMIMADRKSVV